MMKLYVSKVEDRDQGKEKDIKSNKTVSFVEVIENGK